MPAQPISFDPESDDEFYLAATAYGCAIAGARTSTLNWDDDLKSFFLADLYVRVKRLTAAEKTIVRVAGIAEGAETRAELSQAARREIRHAVTEAFSKCAKSIETKEVPLDLPDPQNADPADVVAAEERDAAIRAAAAAEGYAIDGSGKLQSMPALRGSRATESRRRAAAKRAMQGPLLRFAKAAWSQIPLVPAFKFLQMVHLSLYVVAGLRIAYLAGVAVKRGHRIAARMLFAFAVAVGLDVAAWCRVLAAASNGDPASQAGLATSWPLNVVDLAGYACVLMAARSALAMAFHTACRWAAAYAALCVGYWITLQTFYSEAPVARLISTAWDVDISTVALIAYALYVPFSLIAWMIPRWSKSKNAFCGIPVAPMFTDKCIVRWQTAVAVAYAFGGSYLPSGWQWAPQGWLVRTAIAAGTVFVIAWAERAEARRGPSPEAVS